MGSQIEKGYELFSVEGELTRLRRVKDGRIFEQRSIRCAREQSSKILQQTILRRARYSAFKQKVNVVTIVDSQLSDKINCSAIVEILVRTYPTGPKLSEYLIKTQREALQLMRGIAAGLQLLLSIQGTFFELTERMIWVGEQGPKVWHHQNWAESRPEFLVSPEFNSQFQHKLCLKLFEYVEKRMQKGSFSQQFKRETRENLSQPYSLRLILAHSDSALSKNENRTIRIIKPQLKNKQT